MARCLIIGNGVAGITVAKLLREKDLELDIHIVTQEAHPFYLRPRLIDYLKGELGENDLFFYPPRWYEQKNISVSYQTCAQSLQVEAKRVLFSSGLQLEYDFLVLASGAKALVPSIPNFQLPGIFTLRTLADAKAIREKALKSKRALILGGGLLGLEAAYSLRCLNLETTVVERNDHLLPRQLDEEGGQILKESLTDLGLRILLKGVARSFSGEKEVEGLILEDGTILPADLVLISAGVKPDLSYLEGSGLACNFGILVDDQLRTSAPGVFALGDAAEWRGKTWGTIPPCLDQAPVVVSNIQGEERFYRGTTPSHTLKIVGTDLTVMGEAIPKGDRYKQVKAYRPEEKTYYKLVLQEDRVVGTIAFGGRRKFHSTLARYVEERKEMSEEAASKILEQKMED